MRHILIVDDKEDHLFYLQTLFQEHGYTVETAYHGAEALVKARLHGPQLIISELFMPIMDGYTLLHYWKEDALLKHIPFIVYTETYTAPEDERLALSLGADAFILNPLDTEGFLAQVRLVQSRPTTAQPDLPKSFSNQELERFKDYSVTLIRKLHEKTLELEKANENLKKDIARHKLAEDKIQHLAYYDLLTNLPNRRLLIDRLQHTLASRARNQNYGAILFLDLDHFKTINDTKGHSVGDLLLIEVATRLQTCVREGDTLARLGGDEFVLVLEDLSEDSSQAALQAEAACNKIISIINLPYTFGDYVHLSSTSVGICLFRSQEMSVDELLKRADIAMYQAKSAGRNTMCFFDPAMQASLEARTILEMDMRLAIVEDQFKLCYQMQVDYSGKLHGAEALIRWEHPEKGLLLPNSFIPLAEETGLIVQIGRWVLETACQQIKVWENSTVMRDLHISVNVSASQFQDPNFVQQIMEMFNRHSIKPGQLRFELTESVILKNVEESVVKMLALKDIGVRFSIDDFGTGFSSLSYLTKLPLNQLKIDRRFVRNIFRNDKDAVVVQTIIGMAHNLGIEVIAEGVELEEQLEFLARHGCKLFQGYLFSNPLSVEELQMNSYSEFKIKKVSDQLGANNKALSPPFP
ncbi:MAG: diguanylate cyclase [Methylotenera sp.]|nr:MAG: diguanylate cyclase [Methylotenera sp.]